MTYQLNLQISPTPSITSSNTPTITPTLTPCPYSCCFPSGFTTTANSFVAGLYYLPDDTFLFRSALLNWQNTNIPRLGRMDVCGNLLNNYTFPAGIVGSTSAFATQSDGKVLVNIGTALIRLNSNYTIDTTFASGTTNASILGVETNSLDEIIVTGLFSAYTTSAGTVTYNNGVYKLNPNGIPDNTWTGRTIGYISPVIETFDGNLHKDFNGKIILNGNTSTYGDSNYQGIVRLNDDFSLDTTFRAAGFTGTTGSQVFTSEALSDGKYLVGGSFQNYSGLSNQDFLIRLNSNGTLDTSFVFQVTRVNQFVNDVQLQSSGRIIVADQQNEVIAYTYNGAIDPTFMSATTTASGVYHDTLVMLYPNDEIIIAGGFNTYASTAIPRMVKLDINGNLDLCPIATPTMTPSATQTRTPSVTPSITPTTSQTSTPTGTIGLTPTQTPSNTATETSTPTNSPTITQTPSNSATPSITPTNTETPTNTPTNTPSPSETPPIVYNYYFATQYLDCQQNSAPGEWVIRTTLTASTWICGTDDLQYQVTGTASENDYNNSPLQMDGDLLISSCSGGCA